MGASLAAFAFFAALLLMPELGLDRSDDDELKEEAKKRVEEKKEGKRGKC